MPGKRINAGVEYVGSCPALAHQECHGHITTLEGRPEAPKAVH